MPVTDALAWLLGTPSTPSNVFTSTSSQTGDYVIDLGAANTAATYPYLPAFPSRTEQGYSFPPEVVGDGGVEMGVHLVVSTAVVGTSGGMTAGTINVEIGAADTLGTIIASRSLTITQLGIAGVHYFVPVNPAAISARYLGIVLVATTHAADSGTAVMWFGPKTGGEQ